MPQIIYRWYRRKTETKIQRSFLVTCTNVENGIATEWFFVTMFKELNLLCTKSIFFKNVYKQANIQFNGTQN